MCVFKHWTKEGIKLLLFPEISDWQNVVLFVVHRIWTFLCNVASVHIFVLFVSFVLLENMDSVNILSNAVYKKKSRGHTTTKTQDSKHTSITLTMCSVT